MLNSRFRALVAVMAFATAALAACGGNNNNDDKASIRLVNATGRAALDLLANGDLVADNTAKDAASDYVDVDTGSPSLQVNDATTNAVLAVTAPTVNGGQKLALLAYESGGAVRTAVIAEGTALPPSNTAIVRVLNAATDAGTIDVYITDPAADITALSSPTVSFPSSTSVQASNFVSFAAVPPAGGTYRIRVTGAGNTADLRLDIPQVTLLNQQVATVILTPTAGGTLANGSVLIEDGAYSATPNTNARVRLLAAVTNGASVSATAVSASASAPIGLGTNLVAPTFDTYVNVPSDSVLNVTVNGAAVAAPAGSLVPGSDTTLMVYGNAAAASTKLIADDNHLPTASNNYKLRMINGVTGAAVPLAMVVNFATLASNVQPGAASAYSTQPTNPVTATQIDVTSPSSLAPIFSTSATLPSSSVFTLFMLGDAAAPIGRLSRDR